MATFGYAGKILRVDLTSRSITDVSTLDYADRFLGGRGIAAKVYWDEVSPEVNALDAENRLIFVIGPLAGLPVLGTSRWQVCGKSPTTVPEQFCYSNLGGSWGAELKFAGYDAIVVHGKSERPVCLFLHDGMAELKDASALWGKGAIETREFIKGELGISVKVVAIGPAGENMVVMANLLADNDASGSGGLGAVMGSKKLKAVVVNGSGKGVKVAQPEMLRKLTKYYRELGRRIPSVVWGGALITVRGTKKEPCYGCLGCLQRVIHKAANGTKGKYMCQSAIFYQPWADRYHGGQNDVPFYANKLCDNYGLDTMAIGVMIYWLRRCHRAGLLTDEDTGIPISKLGSLEFIESLVKKVSLRDGFGGTLAEGIVKAADSVGPMAKEQITDYFSKAGYGEMYGPRLFINTALLHAMEPRPPVQQLHEIIEPLAQWVNWVKEIEGAYISTDVIRGIARRFWGGDIAADFSTYEGKALATKRIQDRQYAKECLVLCDYLWPIMHIENSEGHVGDPTLESRILSAVTGDEIGEEGLYGIGERVFNLHRAIFIREGHRGRDDDKLPDPWYAVPVRPDFVINPECLVPGRDGEVISREGAVVDKGEFERMKDEYYQLRQWDVATGLQTRAKLEELGLRDISQDLEQRGLVR